MSSPAADERFDCHVSASSRRGRSVDRRGGSDGGDRVGMVGAGGVAQRHARVLSGLPTCSWSGVTDVRAGGGAAAGRRARRAGLRRTSRSCSAPAWTRSYVCVPPFAHGAAEEAVIAAGVPLFVEKPISRRSGHRRRDRRRWSPERELRTAVGHHWRYLAVVEQARDLLAGPAGAAGERRLAGQGAAGGLVAAAGTAPAARWSSRPRTCSTWPGTWPARSPRCAAAGNGTPPPVDGADVDGATAATLRFAERRGRHARRHLRARLEAPRRAGDLRRRAGARRSPRPGWSSATPTATRTVDSDPDAARVAVDRAFIDAVRGERRRHPGAVRRGAAYPRGWPWPSPSPRPTGRPCGLAAATAPAVLATVTVERDGRGRHRRPAGSRSSPSDAGPRAGPADVPGPRRCSAGSRPAPS